MLEFCEFLKWFETVKSRIITVETESSRRIKEMDSKELKWQRRDIFDYTIYEKEEVRSEVLWYWHRTTLI